MKTIAPESAQMNLVPEESTKMKSLREGLELDAPLIYIAGKVSGLHYPDVAAKFRKRAEELSSKGYTVFNPCEFVDESCDWQEAMKICMAHLPYCDFIDLLPDWESSEGAKFERECALKMGIPIFQEERITGFSEMLKTEF
jgi:hypothetical protein